MILSSPPPPSIRAMFTNAVPLKSRTSELAVPAITLTPNPPSITSTVESPLKPRRPITSSPALPSIRSIPSPPLIESTPSPVPDTRNTSSPPPPDKSSSPPPPEIVSPPNPPWISLINTSPRITSSPAPPTIFSILTNVSAPTSGVLSTPSPGVSASPAPYDRDTSKTASVSTTVPAAISIVKSPETAAKFNSSKPSPPS